MKEIAVCALIGAGIGSLFGLSYAQQPSPSPVASVKPQIPIIIAYQNGKAVGAIALGVAESEAECLEAIKDFVSAHSPKPGVIVSTGCMEVPPVPRLETKL